MSTSSIDRTGFKLSVLAGIAFLAACSSKPVIDLESDGERAVSRYAEQREGAAAAESDAVHVPPVPHDPSVEGPAQEAIPEYFRALQAMKAGELESALIALQSLSSRFPQLSGPLVNQGIIYVRQEKFEDAERVIREALSVNNQNPYAHNALGLVLREQGRFDDARTAYSTALTLDPMYARAHFNMGVLAELYMQDYALALQHFRNYQTLQKNADRTVGNWIADLERRVPAAAPAVTPEAAGAAPAAEPASDAEVN